MNSDKYSVRKVMEISGLSRRQLYHYEEKGLIQAERNSSNNYRCYSYDTLCTLDFIKQCRSLGFSIAEIKEYLNTQDVRTLKPTIRMAMNNAREELNRYIANYQRCIERLSSMLESIYFLEKTSEDSCEYEILNMPAVNVVFYQMDFNFYDDAFKHYERLISPLEKIVEKYNFTVISAKQHAWYDHFDAKSGTFDKKIHKYEIFYHVAQSNPSCPHFKIIPEMKMLCATHLGPYGQNLADTYHKIFNYARENTIQLRNVSYEETIFDPTYSRSTSTQWMMKIRIPIVS